MDETPRSAPQSGLYTTIALYAASNALSIAVFLILYHVSAVLADFRDAMLYAFLCSVALRAPKDWLVGWLDWHLSQDRSLILSLFTAIATPYTAVSFLWTEYQDMTKAFRTRVKEIKDEYQRNMVRITIILEILFLRQQPTDSLIHAYTHTHTHMHTGKKQKTNNSTATAAATTATTQRVKRSGPIAAAPPPPAPPLRSHLRQSRPSHPYLQEGP